MTSAEPVKYLNDWSPDGRLVLFHDATGRTIFAADTAAGQTARALVAEGDSFDSVRISPDGRRVAFQSRDTSTTEVYVADFSGFTRRTRVSAAGGVLPRWRGDGRELYYVSDARMLMAVPVGDMAEIPSAFRDHCLPRRFPSGWPAGASTCTTRAPTVTASISSPTMATAALRFPQSPSL